MGRKQERSRSGVLPGAEAADKLTTLTSSEAAASGRVRGAAAGEVFGGAVGSVVGGAAERIATLREEGPPVARAQAEAVRGAALRSVDAARQAGGRLSDAGLTDMLRDVQAGVVAVQAALEGVVEDVRDRGATAVSTLTRRPARRWPWAVGAALAGAAVAASAAVLAKGLLGRDAAEAQEPEQLVAVVDLGARTGSPDAPGPVPGPDGELGSAG